MSEAEALYLVDGNSIAYRAFFALPESIATSDGRPTNAIHGFTSMLAMLIAEHHPVGAIVAWDAGMSGRELVYDAYKAQRPPRPDLLSEQWPHLPRFVEALGFYNVRVEGWEADDVIATLAMKARERGLDVVVVSGDRDVYQLVGEGIRVMATSRGISETKMYDREDVVERYGVPPELVTDLMGLRGDTSDNIPGVPGIGEKTAAKLLQEFGTLEQVLERVDEVSGKKRQENLREHAEDARLSKQLATLERGVELDVDLDEVMASAPDHRALAELGAEFELRTVIERIGEALGERVDASRRADDAPPLEVAEGEVGELAQGPVALAVEGRRFAAADADRVVEGELDREQGPEGLAGLARELEGRPLIGHDLKSLGGARGGLMAAAPGGLALSHDTMVAGYLLEPARRSYELEQLAIDSGVELRARAGDGGRGDDEAAAEGGAQLALGEEPAEEQRDPAPGARTAFDLAPLQRERIAELGLERLLDEVEMPLIEVLAAMESIGVKLDTERLAAIGTGFGERIAELQARIHELAGREFTIGSPQQLGVVLFEELGLTRKRRGKTGYSTDARVLSQIRDEHEIVPLVEQWRELSKLKNTYLDALPGLIAEDTGRLHTTFNQVATATGRLSSTNPNLQNIPIRSETGRPIRGCFVCEPGNRLLGADYNQIELRVLAHVAEDEAMREIFARGEDIHTATAAEVFAVAPEDVGPAERSRAKMVNFGIVYGLTGFGLADRLGIERAEAQAFIDRYLGRFPGVRDFIAETIASAEREGYVKTLLGRRRPIPELRSGNAQRRSLGERLAVNTVIQGTAADVIKIAMVRCHSALSEAGLATRLILQIHDELLFEGPEAEIERASAIVREQMDGAFDLEPGLEIELGVGGDWLALK